MFYLPTFKESREKEYGIFEKITLKFNSMLVDNCLHLENEALLYFCNAYRQNDMDNHILFSGQNGTGKSITALGFAKLMCERIGKPFDVKKNVIYAFDNYNDLIEKLARYEDDVIVVDEANLFFNYKEHFRQKQIALINAVEITRARRNTVISCVRDPRKISLNYRNGKVHTLIHLIDRDSSDGKPIGIGFQGSWFFEREDKFGILPLLEMNDYRSFRERAEQLSTFRGYYKAENILNKNELEEYQMYKREQMTSAILKWKAVSKKSEFDENMKLGLIEQDDQMELKLE